MARYSIGRSRENDIVLTDTTVSRQHAEVEDLGGGRYLLRDVGSSRGTLIDSGGTWQDVTEIEIAADTPILLGEVQTSIAALFREAGIAAAAPAAAAPASAAAPAGPAAASSSSSSLSPGAKWALIGGGIFLVVAVVTAVVLVLVLGDGRGGLAGGGLGGGTGQAQGGATPGGGTPGGGTPGGGTPGGGTPGGGTPGGTPGGGSGGGSTEARFVRACTGVGSATESQCKCMAGVAQKRLSSTEFELFTLMLEARNDAGKRAELQRRAQEAASLAPKLRDVGRAVAQQCR